MKRYGLMLVCLLVSVFAFGQTAQNAVWLIGDGMGIGTMGLLIQTDIFSTDLCLFQFISSVFCSFQCISLSHLWFSLFPNILLCDCKWKCFLNFLFR